MRVVAGVHGGRRLRAPRGQATRPTSDRVREALFSTLGDTVTDAHVLDLFAGSGALGIEALSRGAAAVVFVERDPGVAAVLRENLADLGIDATVYIGDAHRFVRERLADPGMPVFDLVLCDPPYKLHSNDVVALLGRLGRSGHVRPAATMVAERARHSEALTVAEQELHVADVRTYGDTVLYYLRYLPRVDDGGA